MPVSKVFKVANKVGLHARPAAKFVKAAVMLKENSVVIENLTKETEQVNAKSFMCVLSIAANQDDEVRLTIDGENAESAMQVFVDLFDTRFGEAE